MIKQVPTYAKFLKDLCIIKRGLNVNKKSFLTEQVSAIIQCKSPVKYKNLGCPTISMMIGGKLVEKALLDLRQVSVKIPRGMIEDVLVHVNNFYYPVDFVVLNTDPIVKERLPEPLDLLATLPSWRRIEEILPLFNKEEAQEAVKKEAPKLSLKSLPTELKYAYLEENKKCPIVISSSLTTPQEECLLGVLRRCKKAIGCKISNLKGISPLVCTQHIYMEEEAKPVRQPQRRLNPHM
ncbi:hypothetical protein CK203_108791 [Vitis vinifera]|uniref:Uncharacterized protein n=1 Tax=Vitis vinifera TaxID=29760 RepID=A0A438BP85_VITVI|nr:hypothetical protein CK203_108791 [Vitis vinifera]